MLTYQMTSFQTHTQKKSKRHTVSIHKKFTSLKCTHTHTLFISNDDEIYTNQKGRGWLILEHRQHKTLRSKRHTVDIHKRQKNFTKTSDRFLD